MDTLRDYLAPALGDLRHFLAGQPADIGERDREDSQWILDGLADQAAAYARELVQSYDDRMDDYSRYLEALADEAADAEEPFTPPSPPSVIEEEVARISRLRAELDAYIKYLVVFAHRYAIEDFNQSELARLTGATRVTIARWLADEDLDREVTAVVRFRAGQVIKKQQPGDIKDKATASAMGLLRWYSTVGQAQIPDSPADDEDTAAKDGGR